VTEQELLLDCVRRLNASGVQYMLTGSMASNAWGIPRTTQDLDFVIQLPPSQIPALVKAFADPDYFLDEASVRSAYQPPHQFNVIHVPSAFQHRLGHLAKAGGVGAMDVVDIAILLA
jgi:hypothetical protein